MYNSTWRDEESSEKMETESEEKKENDKEKEKEEEDEVEEDEYFIKWKGYSYIHCVWLFRDEILTRVSIKRPVDTIPSSLARLIPMLKVSLILILS